MKRVVNVVNLLDAYNKTLATETDRFNTNLNSSLTAFIKVVENKTAAFESISENVTVMIGNKTDLFLATTASFLTEIKTFNSKFDFNAKLDMFNSRLDMFNATFANFNSKLDTFNWTFLALVLIILLDRVCVLDCASDLHQKSDLTDALSRYGRPFADQIDQEAPRSSENPSEPSKSSRFSVC